MKSLIITGPESTGKSTLAEFLSKSLKLRLIKEHSRDFLNKTSGKYGYEDLQVMASEALEIMHPFRKENLILDTDILTYKVWSQVVYHKTAAWIDNNIPSSKNRLYLLCYPDIPWVEDPLRVNPSDRLDLFKKYEQLLIQNEMSYFIIAGSRKVRFNTALDLASHYFLL